jgi:hypothetical protein
VAKQITAAKEIAALIARLLRHYFLTDEHAVSREAQIEDYIEDLIELGTDNVEAACREWRRQPGGRRPTPGDIRKLAIEERDKRNRPLALAAPDPERIAQIRADRAAVKRKKEDEAAAWRAANPGPYRQSVKTYESVAMDAITGADPVTGEPPLSTCEAMKRVQTELSGFRLKDVDDPGVHARLREMRVDPTALEPTAIAANHQHIGGPNPPTWPVRPSALRRARRR